MPLSWDQLFQAGTLIDLNVSMWRARVKLTPEDLGIEDSPEVRKALSLGCHRLAPSEAFEDLGTAVNAANKTLQTHSVAFNYLRGVRFVPERRYQACIDRLNLNRQAFDAAADEFAARYSEIKNAQLPILRAALEQAARTPEAVESAMKRIEEEYPSPETVRSMFSLSWAPIALSAPRGLAAAQAMEQEGPAIKGVLDGVIREARENLTAQVDRLTKILAEGGKLKSKSIEAARETLNRLADLNIAGDAVLDQQLGRLHVWLNRCEAGAKMDVGGLEGIKAALATDTAEAVQQAEAALVGLGRRRLIGLSGGADAPAAAANGGEV